MANISWKRGIIGQFSDAQDWSSNSVPTPNDNVAINARGTYTVTVSANETIRSLTTISTATLAITGGHRLTVTNGTTGAGASAGTISIADSGALETGGTFQNTGKINLNSTGHATDFVIASNTLLTGDGVVQLSDNSQCHRRAAIPIPVSLLLFPVRNHAHQCGQYHRRIRHDRP